MGTKPVCASKASKKNETPLHNKYGWLENHLQRLGEKQTGFCSVAWICFKSGDICFTFFCDSKSSPLNKATHFRNLTDVHPPVGGNRGFLTLLVGELGAHLYDEREGRKNDR